MPGGYGYLYKGTKGFNEHAISSMATITDVIQWGRDRGLNDPKAQLNKVIEEVGEIAHEICRGHYDSDMLADAIGDTLVTILILADIVDMDPMACLEEAYDVIANRTGETKDGSFIKTEE